MGQSAPSPTYPTDTQCGQITNDEVAFRTKQWLVMGKIRSILDDIKDGESEEDILLNPLKYIVDVHKVLYDLYNGDTVGLSAQVFGTKRKDVGIINGEVYSTPDTILNEYNSYIMSQYPVMSAQDRIIKARDLFERMIPISNNIMTLIMDKCLDDFGRIEEVTP